MVYLEDCLVSNNLTIAYSKYGGAGIYVDSAKLNVLSSEISGNKATGSSSKGGGICSDGYTSVINIADSAIVKNTASYGGGIANVGSLTIINSMISKNTSSISGGGIENSNTLTVINCIISENMAFSYGSGLYTSGKTQITNSSIVENQVTTNNSYVCGCGIYIIGNTTTLTNVTVANNIAQYTGTNNYSSYGGGIYVYSGTLNAYNSIIAANTEKNGTDIYRRSGITNGCNNLSSFVEWGGNENIEYNPNDPLFRSIENGDYRLAPGSQASEKGNNQYAYDAGMDETWFDRAVEPRFIGANIDIGAYESTGFIISQNLIYVGDVSLSWIQYKDTANLRLTWISGVKTTALGTFTSTGNFTWDTKPFADGYGQLKIEFINANGKAILTSILSGHILNDENIVVHRGDVVADETWAVDKVHLVVGRVNIKSGVSLTIVQGAVVKFIKNAYLNNEAEANLAIQANVTFTRAEDDTVGGDTNKDEALSVAKMGNSYIRGAGSLKMADSVTMKFITTTTSGTISSDETWYSGLVYHVTGTVTIVFGATLTILPGTIVKFDKGCSLIIQSGGKLVAEGNATQPIVFTSVKDDSYGGDTNEDDGEYEPSGGDWDCISVYGTATIKYALLSYGAPYNESGIVEVVSGGMVNLDSCTISHAKYDGLWNWGGTINARNTIITDVGFVSAPYLGIQTFTNCVFYEVSYVAMFGFLWTGSSVYKNCIFNKVLTDWIDFQGGNACQSKLTFKNNVFYNSLGSGPQTFSAVGEPAIK